MSTPKAFTPIKVGNVNLQHRIVLAPLTRSRAEIYTRIPSQMAENYYLQRASKGGLLITEATAVDAGMYPRSPGIYSQEQIARWKQITEKVHAKGAYFICQLWHIGRAGHSSFLGHQPVSASDIAILGDTQDKDNNNVPYETPRSLTVPEIKEIVKQFQSAARNAMTAGFDGIELHNGYGHLLDQFIQNGTNKRTDEYGGSVENRARLLLEIIDAICEAIGENRVAVRFSPWNIYLNMEDSDPVAVFSYAISEIQRRHPNFGYVHFVEPRLTANDANKKREDVNLTHFRKIWKGIFVTTGGYNAETGLKQIESGGSDLVAFGRHFLANPDLPERLRNNWPLNAFDHDTFYAGEDKGYTDYPFYQPSATSVTAE